MVHVAIDFNDYLNSAKVDSEERKK